MPILLVEQNTHFPLETAKYAYILENGKMKLPGLTKELKNDQMRQLYLGT